MKHSDMKEVLIFLHMDDKSPGYIEDFLKFNQVPYRIIRSYNQEIIPQWHQNIAGLVFMGGIMSANDDIPWIKEEIRLIKQAMKNNTPILGHCLGGQLISKACGGEVSSNPVLEVGWHRCTHTDTSKAKEWLGEINNFQMFHWHNETFSIPENAELIFSTPHCRHQAYVIGDNILGMQCHVEMTVPLVNSWIDGWQDDLMTSNDSEQCYSEIKALVDDSVAELNQVAEQLYSRWLITLDF